MYNVQVNENGFYMGSYATVGTVKDGVNVTKLPPSENALCYKLIDTEVTEEKQIPILQYSKTVESETEFDTYYTLKSTDEEGNEIETPITEEEYEALDEDANVSITQVPKMITVVLTKNEYNELTDEEKQEYITSYKEDENGKLVYETIQVTKIVKDWEFSQEKYDELLAIKTSQEIENTKRLKVLSLEQQHADIDYIALMSNVNLEYDTYATMSMTLDEYSPKFKDVKNYYDAGLWIQQRVYNMVAKNVITSKEYKEITGEDYK